MSWLTRILGIGASEPRPRDPADDFWWGVVGRESAAGELVTVERALQLPVVYDCLQVLSSTVASLPHSVVRDRDEGGATPEPRHAVTRLIANPNPEQTGAEFVAELVWDLASHGDWMARMVGGGRVPAELRRLDPASTFVERLSDGTRRWVETGDGRRRVHVEGEVIHIRRVPLRHDQLTGTGPIEAGRELIGAALALQQFGARFFANDVTAPLALKHPSSFASDDDRKRFLRAMVDAQTGANRHKPMLLEWGIEAQQLAHTNEQAQFLETRRENNVDLARLWRMPPHKVGILDRATFSNIEQQSLEFVIDTLVPWLTLVERGLAKALLPADRGLRYEFNVSGLLRGDIKARFESYALGRQWGWLSVNDIRRMENMNPVAGGGIYLQPMNMEPAGRPGEDRAQAVHRSLATLHESITGRRA